MIQAPTSAGNNKQGPGGRYVPLRRRRRMAGQEECEFSYLSAPDLTMRFSNADDPIYFVFDCLEQRSVSELMGDFVKDSLFEITNLISKVVR